MEASPFSVKFFFKIKGRKEWVLNQLDRKAIHHQQLMFSYGNEFFPPPTPRIPNAIFYWSSHSVKLKTADEKSLNKIVIIQRLLRNWEIQESLWPCRIDKYSSKYYRTAKCPLYISFCCVPKFCSLRCKRLDTFKHRTTSSKITFQYVLSKGEGILIKSWRFDGKYIFIFRKGIHTLTSSDAGFIIIELVKLRFCLYSYYNRGREKEKCLTFRGPCIVSIFLLIYFQQYTTLHNLFISGKLLYMFRVVSPPIIRSTHNCIYIKGLTRTRCCKYSCVCSW